MRGKARRADKDDESGDRRDEKKQRRTHKERGATTNGRPLKFTSQKANKRDSYLPSAV